MMRKRINKSKVKVYGATPTKDGKLKFTKGVLMLDLSDPAQKDVADMLKSSKFNKDVLR